MNLAAGVKPVISKQMIEVKKLGVPALRRIDNTYQRHRRIGENRYCGDRSKFCRTDKLETQCMVVIRKRKSQ